MPITVGANRERGFCLSMDVLLPIDCFIFHPAKARQSAWIRQDVLGRADTL